MMLTLLGTAAAEGWPAAFCRCAACEGARVSGGHNLRTRSGALLDDDFKIDFGPDTVMQMQRVGRDLSRLTTLVFTHGHDDHFAPNELQYRSRKFLTQMDLPTLHIYANVDIHAMLVTIYPAAEWDDLRIKLHPPLEPLVPVETADGDTLLPLPAAHSPDALLLRITRRGQSILQGHDSGPFPEETVQALAGVPLAVALLDCTYGGANPNSGGHMGIDGVLDTVGRLRDVGAVTHETQIIATHFSHNGGLLQDELTARFASHGVGVAFDGMQVMLKDEKLP